MCAPVLQILDDSTAGIDTQCGAIHRTSLHVAGFKGNSEITALLLERGATVDITDNEGFTALMFAAHGGQDETVELLLRANANANQSTASGSNTALYRHPSRASTAHQGGALTVQLQAQLSIWLPNATTLRSWSTWWSTRQTCH